jgi:hypothetical protein
MKPKPAYAEWLIMMEYDDKCQLDPTMPLKYPCIRYNIHLATLVIISLCPMMMSQSGDITQANKHKNKSKRYENTYLVCFYYKKKSHKVDNYATLMDVVFVVWEAIK